MTLWSLKCQICELLCLPTSLAFTEEVLSPCDSIDALRSEAAGLRSHGGGGEGRMVDRWVSDVVGRWEDLSGTLEERQVCVCVCVWVGGWGVYACVLCACVCTHLYVEVCACVEVCECVCVCV